MTAANKQNVDDTRSALVGATDASGKSIFAGKPCTGFSNAEEEAIDKVKVSIIHPVFGIFSKYILNTGCAVLIGRQAHQPWRKI